MRFVADENFNGDILKQLRELIPHLDVIRVQDTALYQASDPEVLDWAAREGRIILTHDVQTLVGDAYKRIEGGLPMPGVILVPTTLPTGKALEDLEMIIRAGDSSDFESRVTFIPLH